LHKDFVIAAFYFHFLKWETKTLGYGNKRTAGLKGPSDETHPYLKGCSWKTGISIIVTQI
jgi:hypothetical protein